MSRHYKNRRGFSLAEAMIATVVLGIAAAGALLPFTSGGSIREEGRRYTLGAKLASDLMEQILTSTFDEVLSDHSGSSELEGNVQDSSGDEFTDAAYAKFSRQVSTQYPYNGNDRLLLAVVSVYYDGREMATVKRVICKEN